MALALPQGRGRRRPVGGRQPVGGGPLIKRLPGGNLPQGGPTPVRPNPRGRGMMNPPGQGPVGAAQPVGGRGGRGRAPAGKGQGQGIGVGGAAMPGPGGRQLAARVASGAITQEQADRTMQQRQTLAKALGPNWREKLSVGGQSFAQVNAGLKKSPGDPKLAALRKKLLENRKSVLEGARKKNQGGGEEEGES